MELSAPRQDVVEDRLDIALRSLSLLVIKSQTAPQRADGERINAAQAKHGSVNVRPKKPKLRQKE